MLETEGSSVTLSLLDPDVQSNPYPFYASLHAEEGVYRVPELGVYIVSRYDEVKSVLLNTTDFSNEFGGSVAELQGPEGVELYESIFAERGWPHRMSLQNADPPLHTKHRKLLEPAFSRKSVKALEPYIDRIINDLIDAFIDQGRCDFVADFAHKLPGIVVAGLIGLPPGELPKFKRWADALMDPMVKVLSREGLIESAEAEIELQHYLADRREAARKEPTGDLISLLASQPDDVLPMDEFQFVMRQLVAGGFETTSNGISHALWSLLRYPGQMAKLRAQPELRANFVEEALRFESPSQGLLRRTTRDVEIAGTPIPANSIVMTRYAAANHDPQQFPRPGQFDIERKNASTHMAFGHGIHFCIGRTLARVEISSAFRILFDRIDNIELERPLDNPPHFPSLLLRPIKELPIKFTKKEAAPSMT